MLDKIIIGYDGGSEAADALALGRSLASLTGGRLILAAVLPVKEEPIGRNGYEQALKEDSDRLFAEVLPELDGLDVDTRALGEGLPADALRGLALAEKADAIVVGSTHRGPLGRIYPGSVAERLLHDAPCAVSVAPRGFARRESTELRVLAAAFDGSPESEAALGLAIRLAAEAQGTLRVLTVHEPFTPGTAVVAPMGTTDVGAATQREAMEARLHDAVAELPPAIRAKGLLLKGQAADELLDEIELGVDLLAMGTRGRGRLGRAVLGGVSAKVIRSASCPVIVLPKAPDPSQRTAAGTAAGAG